MVGQRRRSKGMPRSDDEDNGVIILSSSDDEEANRDLSLEIVEQAKQREAKRKRQDDKPGASAPFAFIDLSSASPSSDEPDAKPGKTGGGRLWPETPAEGERVKKKRKKKKTKSKAVEENGASPREDLVKEEEPNGTGDSVVTEANETADNAILRKLLRGPRYFDPGDRILETCRNCGEEGHRAFSCSVAKRQKPCFVCGMFGHNARQCTQGQDCYICKRRGHIAKDCPNKDKQIAQDSKLCLRCGDIGHDMFSCKNNYVSDDLKEIQCYICKKHGHLCCASLTFPAPEEVSCYKCAQSGHTGLGCAKQNGETSTAASPSTCYKCGEEGHFARGCSRATKSSNKWKEESWTPQRFPKKNRGSPRFKLAPHDIGKPNKKKNLQHEDRRGATSSKSRRKGGWMVDDPGDVPTTRHKAHGWKSPNSSGTFSSPQSYWKKHRPFSGTPESAYQHGYSTPRYGSSQGRHSWRT